MFFCIFTVKDVHITQEGEKRRESIIRQDLPLREEPRIRTEPKTREDFMKCESFIILLDRNCSWSLSLKHNSPYALTTKYTCCWNKWDYTATLLTEQVWWGRVRLTSSSVSNTQVPWTHVGRIWTSWCFGKVIGRFKRPMSSCFSIMLVLFKHFKDNLNWNIWSKANSQKHKPQNKCHH